MVRKGKKLQLVDEVHHFELHNGKEVACDSQGRMITDPYREVCAANAAHWTAIVRVYFDMASYCRNVKPIFTKDFPLDGRAASIEVILAAVRQMYGDSVHIEMGLDYAAEPINSTYKIL